MQYIMIKLTLCLVSYLQFVNSYNKFTCIDEDTDNQMTARTLLNYYDFNGDSLCWHCSDHWRKEILLNLEPDKAVKRYRCYGDVPEEYERLSCVDLLIRYSSTKLNDDIVNFICCRYNSNTFKTCSDPKISEASNSSIHITTSISNHHSYNSAIVSFPPLTLFPLILVSLYYFL